MCRFCNQLSTCNCSCYFVMKRMAKKAKKYVPSKIPASYCSSDCEVCYHKVTWQIAISQDTDHWKIIVSEAQSYCLIWNFFCNCAVSISWIFGVRLSFFELLKNRGPKLPSITKYDHSNSGSSSKIPHRPRNCRGGNTSDNWRRGRCRLRKIRPARDLPSPRISPFGGRSGNSRSNRSDRRCRANAKALMLRTKFDLSVLNLKTKLLTKSST